MRKRLLVTQGVGYGRPWGTAREKPCRERLTPSTAGGEVPPSRQEPAGAVEEDGLSAGEQGLCPPARPRAAVTWQKAACHSRSTLTT